MLAPSATAAYELPAPSAVRRLPARPVASASASPTTATVKLAFVTVGVPAPSTSVTRQVSPTTMGASAVLTVAACTTTFELSRVTAPSVPGITALLTVKASERVAALPARSSSWLLLVL